jgi:two-component system NtrC family sensor kinase
MVLSGYADTAAVVAAINEGQIYKFIPKPWNDDELRMTVIKAIETFSIHKQNLRLEEELRRKNSEMAVTNENLERLLKEGIADKIIPSHAQANARAILQKLPVGVIELMQEGTISQLNAEAAEILGCEKENTAGRSMLELLPDSLVTAFRALTEQTEYSAKATIDGREISVKGRKVKGAEEDEIILVLYAGA